ncbi:MAG: sortase [Lachnospiraceae bacterium]|nr:sortase [Lachnospiraceae bacterium]
MSRIFGKLLVLIGILLLLAAGAKYGMNRLEEQRGEQVSAERLLEMRAIMRARRHEENAAASSADSQNENAVQEMDTIEINGVSYIGYISIPDAGIDLPVQADWSEEKLKDSPCRYAGTLLNHNLVIAGHNYLRHFTPIKELKKGAKIFFTDVNDHEYLYEVILTEEIAGTDTAGMTAKDVDWDLSVFTCTYGGKNRFTLRCRMME